MSCASPQPRLAALGHFGFAGLSLLGAFPVRGKHLRTAEGLHVIESHKLLPTRAHVLQPASPADDRAYQNCVRFAGPAEVAQTNAGLRVAYVQHHGAAFGAYMHPQAINTSPFTSAVQYLHPKIMPLRVHLCFYSTFVFNPEISCSDSTHQQSYQLMF